MFKILSKLLLKSSSWSWCNFLIKVVRVDVSHCNKQGVKDHGCMVVNKVILFIEVLKVILNK